MHDAESTIPQLLFNSSRNAFKAFTEKFPGPKKEMLEPLRIGSCRRRRSSAGPRSWRARCVRSLEKYFKDALIVNGAERERAAFFDGTRKCLCFMERRRRCALGKPGPTPLTPLSLRPAIPEEHGGGNGHRARAD